jgi:hypothetical protein
MVQSQGQIYNKTNKVEFLCIKELDFLCEK